MPRLRLPISSNILATLASNQEKTVWLACLIALVLVMAEPPPIWAQTTWDLGPVIFHTCYDGDTCMVSLPGVHPLFGDHIPVRLLGIDTPEIKGKCEQEKRLAKEARDFARTFLSEAKEVRLVGASRGDKYFRILGRLVADGQDLSQSLIDAHLAVPYNGGTKTARWCESL